MKEEIISVILSQPSHSIETGLFTQTACCCFSWTPGQQIGHKMFLFGFFGSDERWRAERSSLHFLLAVKEKREEADVNHKIAHSLPKHEPGDTTTWDQAVAAVVLRLCAVAGHTGILSRGQTHGRRDL